MSFIDNIDNIPELGGNSKISESYVFNASSGLVIVNDFDFERVLFIYNETAQTAIYRLGSDTLTGSTYNREVKVDLDTTSMSNSDKLIIFYKKVETEFIIDFLQQIKDEIKKTNKLLNKIYN